MSDTRMTRHPIRGALYGLLIGLIACGNGLKVTGGAAGVGNATTRTVVQSVVAVIFAESRRPGAPRSPRVS